jgi:hypothetical protein
LACFSSAIAFVETVVEVRRISFGESNQVRFEKLKVELKDAEAMTEFVLPLGGAAIALDKLDMSTSAWRAIVNIS